MPKIIQRKLSPGEIAENKLRLKEYQPNKKTYTYSERIGNLWYMIYQKPLKDKKKYS